MRRSARARIEAGRVWLADKRREFGLEYDELAAIMDKMAHGFHVEGTAPDAEAIRQFEEEGSDVLQVWLRLAFYAFDVDDGGDPGVSRPLAWLGERNWFHAQHPFDASRPMLFREESDLIEQMAYLTPDQRQAVFAFFRSRERRLHGGFAEAAEAMLHAFGLRATVEEPVAGQED